MRECVALDCGCPHANVLCGLLAAAGTARRRWVALRRGAVVQVPKALRADRFVAGQLPTGWDPRALGIPDDIVNQVRCRSHMGA